MESPSPSNVLDSEPGESAQPRLVARRTRRPPQAHVNKELSAVSIRDFAKVQLDERLKRVEKEWGRCAGAADEIAIHDFRVALRRFGEGLWLFRRLFPRAKRRQVREELRAVMRLSARVRDVDIVMGSFTLAGVTVSTEILLFLQNERSIAEAAFEATLAVGLRTEAGKRWRQTLHLVQEAAAPSEAIPDSPGEAADTVAETVTTAEEGQT